MTNDEDDNKLKTILATSRACSLSSERLQDFLWTSFRDSYRKIESSNTRSYVLVNAELEPKTVKDAKGWMKTCVGTTGTLARERSNDPSVHGRSSLRLRDLSLDLQYSILGFGGSESEAVASQCTRE